ncbi:MAG: glycoside hydrolase [Pedobacter sp.]|nr:MAG: glycoside hydrolase [Pedobacter sp.]
MRKAYLFILIILNTMISGSVYSQKLTASKQAPGAALLPVPQKVSFTDQRYIIDAGWSITTGPNISKNNPAILSLVSGLKERFGLALTNKVTAGAGNIHLLIKPGTVVIGPATDTNRTALTLQAYEIKLKAGKITITANGAPGLFYGVQTLVQLLQPENGKTFFTAGEIVDWPDMDLRMIYWDNAHHLQRLEAMKRAIRQASYYKINAFTVKLEGHFQFQSAKPIVEPYAYTAAEYAELSEYAKAHYIELVPWIDGPAHISFILKHPEYQALRTFPNSNYQLDVTNPKADELLLGMFDELMNANKGGKYVLFSTDEAYYAGMSTGEKKRAEELGSNGKLLAAYIKRIADKLHAKGRKVIIWAEYPLTINDIDAIPSHIISGVYNKDWAAKIKSHGMRQLIYTSTQGMEPHFPNYHKPAGKKAAPVNNAVVVADDDEPQGEIAKGRVGEVVEGITSTIAERNADLMGVIVAAWGDAGLNPETFWLGYATGGAAGWKNAGVTPDDLSNRFYKSFYGYNTVNMNKVYELLSTQADFWDKSWDWDFFDFRKPIFGNSYKVYDTPRLARDQTLPLLAVPSGTDLSFKSAWNLNNKPRLDAARKYLSENDELMKLLSQNVILADYQHYNLQVLQSVALLTRQNLNMLLDMKKINELLEISSGLAASNPKAAVALIDQALDQAQEIYNERNEMLQNVTTTWYQDWHPRVPEANGRKFLDQVDDVKDHQPVRTVDMSYLIYRQLKYPLGKWAADLVKARNQFAVSNNLPIKSDMLEWEKYW